MSAPDFNDPKWLEENLFSVPKWLHSRDQGGWVVKRRFDPDAPKGRGLVSWHELGIDIRLQHEIAWQGSPRASIYLIGRSANTWNLWGPFRAKDGDGADFFSDEELPSFMPTAWVGVLLRGTESRRRTDIYAIQYPDFDSPPDDPEEPDVTEPTSLLSTVKAIRAKYGTPLQNEEMGMLLNEVAWIHRVDGWGCAQKPTGKHTIQPTTGIRMSRDLLYHKPTEKLFDVLADVEGEARPVWNEVENDGKLPWLAPIVPEGTPDPDPDPQPDDLEQRVAMLEDWARGISYDG